MKRKCQASNFNRLQIKRLILSVGLQISMTVACDFFFFDCLFVVLGMIFHIQGHKHKN